MNQRGIMRLSRSPVAPLVPPVLVMAGVVSLLLFFYSDTPHYSQSLRHGLASDQPGRKFSRSQEDTFRGRHQTDKHIDAIPASSVTSRGRDVIVVSLARSGSSFTGDVVSHAPGVYYVFEPLRHAEKLYWEQYVGVGDKKTSLQWWHNQTKSILQHFLSCDFSGLDLSLLDPAFLSRQQRTRLLGRCVEEQGRVGNVSACVHQAQQNCRRTDSRALKVIRLSVRDLLPLLTSRPDLALVLLVRDPRASLWSRVNVFNRTLPQDYSTLFRDMCHRLDNDVTTVMEVPPGGVKDRIRIFRYETLAEEPMRISRLLYRYLGLKWNRHVERQIQTQTSSGWRVPFRSGPRPKRQGANPAFSVVKEDSAQASRAWRSSVHWPFVQSVQRQCFGVMRTLGYSLFRSEHDLRDLATRSYNSEDSFAMDTDVLLQ